MPSTDDTLLLSILKELRAEMREHKAMLLQLVDASRRHDRRFDDLEHRFGDLRGELELMLKGELMGRLSHFETQIDEKLERLSDRLRAVET
ncbi:MAG: hypothetical protein ABR878_08315 [Roseiarcus sp.]|jgi:hypothetical protein